MKPKFPSHAVMPAFPDAAFAEVDEQSRDPKRGESKDIAEFQ
ncbi:hypothetical protein OKA05_17620 [Luteolibacter arcticus]|uniref:Uncharacterized protein n=1 Tax=Luteolibacter arcticus TaxID=1581411 RepID=A0ABT3GLJ4_9BACT|nr:hypothetical protein [Luteolibacter arcticus]MCW1924390.1 hypothetical protein [Luteolibacter arcticus]